MRATADTELAQHKAQVSELRRTLVTPADATAMAQAQVQAAKVGHCCVTIVWIVGNAPHTLFSCGDGQAEWDNERAALASALDSIRDEMSSLNALVHKQASTIQRLEAELAATKDESQKHQATVAELKVCAACPRQVVCAVTHGISMWRLRHIGILSTCS